MSRWGGIELVTSDDQIKRGRSWEASVILNYELIVVDNSGQIFCHRSCRGELNGSQLATESQSLEVKQYISRLAPQYK